MLGLTEIQYVPVEAISRRIENLRSPNVVSRPRRDLHEKVRRDFAQAREEALAWVARKLEPVRDRDFWGSSWRTFFENGSESTGADNGIALVGAGGSGKSICLAHFLEDLTRKDVGKRFYPFLIRPVLLRSGDWGVYELLHVSRIAGAAALMMFARAVGRPLLDSGHLRLQ